MEGIPAGERKKRSLKIIKDALREAWEAESDEVKGMVMAERDRAKAAVDQGPETTPESMQQYVTQSV